MDSLEKKLAILEKFEAGELDSAEAIVELRSDSQKYLASSEIGYWEQMGVMSSLAIRVIRLEEFFLKNYNSSLKETKSMPLQVTNNNNFSSSNDVAGFVDALAKGITETRQVIVEQAH